jgi:hypothetical protein
MGYLGAGAAIACYLPLAWGFLVLKSGGARRLTVVVRDLVGSKAQWSPADELVEWWSPARLPHW